MLETPFSSTPLHHPPSNVLAQSQDPIARLISKQSKKHLKKIRRFQMMVWMDEMREVYVYCHLGGLTILIQMLGLLGNGYIISSPS